MSTTGQTPQGDTEPTGEHEHDSSHGLAAAPPHHGWQPGDILPVETHPLTPAMAALLRADIARYRRLALFYVLSLPLICAIAFVVIGRRHGSAQGFIFAATLWGLIFYGAALVNLHLGRVGEADLFAGTFLRVTGPLSARSLFWAGKDRRWRVRTAHGVIKTTAEVGSRVDGLFGAIDYTPQLGLVFAVWSTKREPIYLAPGCRAEEVA